MKATRIYTENLNSDAYITVNRGGTRSSKTYSLCQLALTWLLDNSMAGKMWTIARATSPALRSTAYRDFQDIAKDAGVFDSLHWSKTSMSFSLGGKTVEFTGLDDQMKMRSRKRDILHVCESNEINYEMFIQLMLRTRLKIFLDINPSDSGSENWIKNQIEEERRTTKHDVDIIISTYKDNPHLTPNEIENIEHLSSIDPELWNVFGLGEWGSVTGQVYKDYEVVTHIPEEVEYRYYGLDFGYQNPCAIVECAIHNEDLYVREVLYETKLSNRQLAAKMLKLRKHQTVADSAEPKSIDELRREGCDVIPVNKTKDAVYAGIMLVKSYNLKVVAGSHNVIKELRNYKWSERTPDKPIKMYDHAMDALRYCTMTYFRRHATLRTGIGSMITSDRDMM